MGGVFCGVWPFVNANGTNCCRFKKPEQLDCCRFHGGRTQPKSCAGRQLEHVVLFVFPVFFSAYSLAFGWFSTVCLLKMRTCWVLCGQLGFSLPLSGTFRESFDSQKQRSWLQPQVNLLAGSNLDMDIPTGHESWGMRPGVHELHDFTREAWIAVEPLSCRNRPASNQLVGPGVGSLTAFQP